MNTGSNAKKKKKISHFGLFLCHVSAILTNIIYVAFKELRYRLTAP